MIKKIHLQNYRSYKDKTFIFKDGVNIVVGPNGSGKTNLLEAILVVCDGKSYRASDLDLIHHASGLARIEARTSNDDIRTVVLDKDSSKIKSYKINEDHFTRLSMQRKIPVVLFEPNNLQLLNGPAELRRQFLDDLLEKIKPNYGVLRRSYRRTLAQRNNLLKRDSLDKDQLFAWNIRLCNLGEQIATYRHNLCSEINELIEDTYISLSGPDIKIEFSYATDTSIDNYASLMLSKLETNLEADKERGFTSCGPHREDISVLINNKPLMVTSSRGEVRTMVLALKIIEALIIEKERGIKPILLLDDVFSELDKDRVNKLTMFIQTHQSFITTTTPDILNYNKQNKPEIIKI